MSNEFRSRIRRSLADANLQAALDANAERRRTVRTSAFASLPDHQERRQKAHAIKAEVVARLDETLAQFLEKVEANGIIVHRAADADEAVRLILKIIGDLPQRTPRAQSSEGKTFEPRLSPPFGDRDLRGEGILVAKSKSMVSEEIDLNHALEAAGVRVVETDLGEYIVQLRGERPSHIITPAVHLRRGDVGKLFEEKLGIPYTEDIPVLTNTARKVLRQVFLTADVGFSGVNFGVAETGTLCVVTNEGNGRMVTTVPPVHIALMGLERLVPTLDDLALFLSLLPRSATGQKLSVYTNLMHKPLPGQIRHLVVLDNGRTALRASSLAESLYCIRCGACLNACPVFRELGGHAYGSIYPGPIGSVISSALVDPKFACLAQASSLCGACKEACPVDIDLPELLLRVRAGNAGQDLRVRPGTGIPWTVRLGLKGFRLAAHPGLFALGQRLLGLGARIVSPRREWMRLPAVTGWGYSKDFPRPAAKPFRARYHREGGKEAKDFERKEKKPAAEGVEIPTAPRMDLAEEFSAELKTLGGETIRCRAAELSGRVAAFLKGRGIERVLVDAAGAELLSGSGIAPLREPDPEVKAGLTGCLAGVADTGTLVLVAGPGTPLTASLLPEIHLAVLHRSALLASLPEALALEEFRGSPAAVLVTGPSRTADIEMTLTIGVHGPGELVVFLVDDL